MSKRPAPMWKFIKRRSPDGRDPPAFADFRTAIDETLIQLPTTDVS